MPYRASLKASSPDYAPGGGSPSAGRIRRSASDARGRALGLVVACALLLVPSLTRGARAAPVAHPRVVLVLCDGLTLDDIRSSSYPHLADLAAHAAVGMMNCSVGGPKNSLSAALTIAVGDHAAGEPTDGNARNGWEAVDGELGDAADVYTRRTGLYASGSSDTTRIYHLGIASLERRGLASDRLGALLARAIPPRQSLVCGNGDAAGIDRSAALLTVDAQGAGYGVLAPLRRRGDAPFDITDDPVALGHLAASYPADFVVLEMGDLARLDALNPRPPSARFRDLRSAALRRLNILVFLLTTEMKQRSEPVDILVVSPRPLVGEEPRAFWDRLTPIVGWGPDFPPGLLTSATTRTPGLVANIDIAPTVLGILRAPVPDAMIGRPLHSIAAGADGSERLAQVARIDFVALLDGRGVTLITVPLGAACFLLVVAGLVHFRKHGPLPAPYAAAGVVYTQNLATAMLPATLLIPPTLPEYGLRIAAWMAVLTIAAYLLARPLRTTPVVVSALMGILLVVGDALAGQPLLKQSLLSGYAMSGIRYYGIGNEYLGVLLGFAILGGFAWLDDLRIPSPGAMGSQEGVGPRYLVAGLWAVLAFVLAWPGLGANAGSLAATGAGFAVGGALLAGRRPTWKLAIGGMAIGLVLAFAFGMLDAALSVRGAESHASHIGAAIHQAAGGRGPAYLAAIAARKVAMNIRLVASPWLLLAAAPVIVVAAAARALLADSISTVLRERPWTARGLSAAAAAAAAALVFKDSGIVTVVFLAGSTCMMMLYYILSEDNRTGATQQ